MRCGSVWACPVCALQIKAERADDVRRLVEWHGQGNVYLVTLTVRHGLGDDLGAIRRGVARAWRRVQQGAPWQRWKRDVGMVGSVRALEVTHGANGFHPHLHLLLLGRPMDPAVQESARRWLSMRWQLAVAAELGRDAVPNDRRGCDWRPCHSADYVQKLGLELTDPATKRARGENRAPLQIAYDFTQTGDEADLNRWLAYCEGMKGAKQLTWTKGLRAAAQLGEEKTDEEIVEGEDGVETTLYAIPGKVWDAIRDKPDMMLKLLEAAERDDVARIEQLCQAPPPCGTEGMLRQ